MDISLTSVNPKTLRNPRKKENKEKRKDVNICLRVESNWSEWLLTLPACTARYDAVCRGQAIDTFSTRTGVSCYELYSAVLGKAFTNKNRLNEKPHSLVVRAYLSVGNCREFNRKKNTVCREEKNLLLSKQFPKHVSWALCRGVHFPPFSQILSFPSTVLTYSQQRITLNTEINVLPMTKFALREQRAAGQGPDGISTCSSFAFNFFSSSFVLAISLRGLRRQMLNIKIFETWSGIFSYIATKNKMRTVRFAVLR